MDEHGVAIREFLRGFVAGEQGQGGFLQPQAHWAPQVALDLNAEIERHDGPTTVARTSEAVDKPSGCAECLREEIQPCAALRFLAVPYASHPAYRSEWLPETTDDIGTARVWTRAPIAREASTPPPYPLIANLPAPGMARRSALREARINVSRNDPNAEEQADRGWHTPGSIPYPRSGGGPT